MVAKDREFDPQVIATTLMGCVQTTLEQMYNLKLSQDPEFEEKEIIEYASRMQTFGLEKFNGPCYISAINFYLSPRHLEEHDPVGAIVIYIREDLAVRFLKALGFEDADEEDEEIVLDCCGELANIITGQFKNELTSLGYKDLTISAPIKAKNDIPGGVEFNYNEYKLYELTFYLWKEKTMVINITMAPVEHA